MEHIPDSTLQLLYDAAKGLRIVPPKNREEMRERILNKFNSKTNIDWKLPEKLFNIIKIPDSFNKNKDDHYRLYAFYTHIYILACNEYIDPIPLFQNSVNSYFTTLPFMDDTDQDRNHFVKFAICEPSNKVDWIMIDNVNGIIMNDIVRKHPQIRPNVMVYQDSFKTFVHVTDNLIEWIPSVLTDIDNPDQPCNIEELRKKSQDRKSISDWEPVCCSIYESIDGDSMKTMTRTSQLWQKAFSKFAELYETIVFLGTEYGMMHNDLHLGNIFYDKMSDQLVMIDYGRMHFQAKEDATVEVEYPMKKNGFRIKPYKYSSLDRFNHHLKANFIRNPNGLYCMTIMDLMCLSANVALEAARFAEGWLQDVSFIEIIPHKIRGESQLKIKALTVDDLGSEFVKTMKRVAQNKNVACACEGIYFLANYLLFHGVPEIYIKDIEQIDLYFSFQFIGSHEIAQRFVVFIMNTTEFLPPNEKNAIANAGILLKKLIPPTSQSGGMLQSRTTSIRRLNTTLRNRTMYQTTAPSLKLDTTPIPSRVYKSNRKTIHKAMVTTHIKEMNELSPPLNVFKHSKVLSKSKTLS